MAKRTRSKSPTHDYSKTPGTTSSVQRVAFLVHVVEHAKKTQIKGAMHHAGLRDGRAPQSLVRLMVETGGLADRPRSGRPTDYPDELMELAADVLIESEQDFMNERELHAKLVNEGILLQHSDVQNFMRHLKGYVEGLGHRLITTATGTELFLRQSDVRERWKYCQDNIDFFTRKQLEMTVFIDETDLEEYPHPKGWPFNTTCMHTLLNQ